MTETFPDWCSVLLVGSPGIGALEFNISMVKKYLDEGETVVFVTADLNADNILYHMERFGIDVKNKLGEQLFLIDYHSSLLGTYDNGDRINEKIQHVIDLEGIMFNIDEIAETRGTPIRIFIYSLSTLFLYNQPNVVLKFFQISSSKIRSDFGFAIFTLHDGVHDGTTVNHLMAIADGVIELKFDEELKKQMRIRHMRGIVTSPQWIPFEIKHIQTENNRPLLEWK
jgi:KaiC/GvpD/RAD55 family RecA-like ATPase